MNSIGTPTPYWVSADLLAERGPNAEFQMYTTEGNDAVGAMLLAVTTEATERLWMRGAIIEALQKGVAEVRKVHPEIFDTEPEWAIVDAMNFWLQRQGFLTIGRDDLSA